VVEQIAVHAAVHQPLYPAPRRILIGDTDEGQRKRTEIDDLEALTEAYGNGLIREKME